MKPLRLLFAALFVSVTPLAIAAEGLVTISSPLDAKNTMNRFEELAKARGLTMSARVDHAAGVVKAGKTLRPTEVLIFGSPQGGTPLLECAQSAGIDLPLKALVWEDVSAKVWLGYNDPAHLAKRHDLALRPAIEILRKALSSLADAAIARQ